MIGEQTRSDASQAEPVADDLNRRQDVAYLDFVVGIRLFCRDVLMPVISDAAPELIEQFREANGREPTSIEDARQVFDASPVCTWNRLLSRTAQEMNWAKVIHASQPFAERLEQELHDLESSGPGSLTVQPDFNYPEYFNSVDFHIQPGGYARWPLAGYLYFFGANVFQQGITGKPAQQNKRVFVDAVPAPHDGLVQKALDVGCGPGWTTWPLKLRYPDAEIWGIDMSEAMVRYAHKMAVQRGLALNFAQMPAEKMTFADDTFDVVHAHILFHEVPVEVGRAVVREAFRVLRPGGIFAISDFPTATPDQPPLRTYMRAVDGSENGEPYAEGFVRSDILDAFRSAGFTNVEEHPVANMSMRTGVKP